MLKKEVAYWLCERSSYSAIICYYKYRNYFIHQMGLGKLTPFRFMRGQLIKANLVIYLKDIPGMYVRLFYFILGKDILLLIIYS